MLDNRAKVYVAQMFSDRLAQARLDKIPDWLSPAEQELWNELSLHLRQAMAKTEAFQLLPPEVRQ